MHNIYFPVPIDGGEVHKLEGLIYLTILKKRLNNALKDRTGKIVTLRIKFRSEILFSGVKQVTAKETQVANMLVITFTCGPAIRHGPTQNNFDIKGLTFKVPTKVSSSNRAINLIAGGESSNSRPNMGVPVEIAFCETTFINKSLDF